MNRKPYASFAIRLLETMKKEGYTATRSPNGVCMKTLAEFTGASEQICRRYIRGDALPDYEKIKKLACRLQVNPGWLLFGEEKFSRNNELDENILHYVLKHSHHLYPVTEGGNNDYADFVLGLLREVRSIATDENTLFKIVDLAIGSIALYEEKNRKLERAV